MGTGKKTAIKRVVVEKLFGLYDYEIPRASDARDITTILILYGDNGCGKTTLLRLIFRLLAWEHRSGHKSFVAATKFGRMIIDFSNQHRLIVSRKGESLLGSFTMCLEKNGKSVAQTEFLADSKNSIPPEGPNEQENNDFLDQLREMNLTLYLLGDDRTVRISSPEGERRHLDRKWRLDAASEEGAYQMMWGQGQERIDPEQIAIRLVEESMDRLRGWIRDHVMRGSTRGELDVHGIFANIVESIAADTGQTPRKKATRREHLVERIRAIEERNKEFRLFGLTPAFNGQKLLKAITKASVNRFKDIRPILVPYLESLEAKLDALSDVQNTIHKLIRTLNSFVIDKTASFHVARGLRMESRNHEHLRPEMLSSGERHLLLLFCNAVAALDRQSIFIIDEPEISLNVKWQRNLVSSLQELAQDSPVQFVFATHSLEILSQQVDKVVRLESRGNLNDAPYS